MQLCDQEQSRLLHAGSSCVWYDLRHGVSYICFRQNITATDRRQRSFLYLHLVLLLLTDRDGHRACGTRGVAPIGYRDEEGSILQPRRRAIKGRKMGAEQADLLEPAKDPKHAWLRDEKPHDTQDSCFYTAQWRVWASAYELERTNRWVEV